MVNWRSQTAGFTIVELLIVIVVIGILAAITIVAYNGIQDRSKTSKTVSSVSQWVKILNMYNADNGSYPSMSSCLGSGYGKGFDGTATSGGDCREDNSTSSIVVSPTFMTAMSKYIQGNGPTPSFVTSGAATYPWYRGAYFYPAYTGSPARIDFIVSGNGNCPDVGQVAMTRTYHAATNTMRWSAALETL